MVSEDLLVAGETLSISCHMGITPIQMITIYEIATKKNQTSRRFSFGSIQFGVPSDPNMGYHAFQTI